MDTSSISPPMARLHQVAGTPPAITAADVEEVRRDLAAWTGDLVGWLDR